MKYQNKQKGSITALILGAVMILSLIGVGVVEYKQEHKLAEIEQTQEDLGSTNKIPDIIALFETTLASRITADATSFTLTSATDKDGNTLASSTYPFIIDEGTSKEEFVIADCTGTACTNVTRGISVLTGTSTVASLKQIHGRGASVKITDAPILMIHNRLLQGIDGFDNILSYSSEPSFTTQSTQFATVNYAEDLANQGAATSSETIAGISELATALEAASSTDNGANDPLVLQAKYATDTPSQSSVSGTKIIMSAIGGYMKQGWINLTEAFTWTGNHIFNGTVTFNSTATFSSAIDASTYSSQFTASTTFTGATLPQPAYIATTTGNALLSDANVSVATNFHGFAISNASDGGSLNIQSAGVVDGFTGLTPGSEYYVQDAVGTIGTTVGTSEIYVGDAISATQILIRSRTDQFLSSDVIADTTSIATSTVPLYTKTIIIEYRVQNTDAPLNSTLTLKWKGIGGDGTSVVMGTACNHGTATCTNQGSVSATWDVPNSTLVYNPSGTLTSANATAYFYR